MIKSKIVMKGIRKLSGISHICFRFSIYFDVSWESVLMYLLFLYIYGNKME